MYLEDAQTHSYRRVLYKLRQDKKLLEGKIVKSTSEYEKYHLLQDLEALTAKKIAVETELCDRLDELKKPKSFWKKLFRK